MGAKQPASDATPQPIQAVIVDTNALGKGNLRLTTLEGIAKRLAPRRIPVWVPSQVVAEWAVHAAETAQTWNEARRAARKAAAQLAAAGVETVDTPDVPTWLNGDTSEAAVELRTRFRSAVGALGNVEVLPARGDSAVAAIDDQILGTGPGTKADGGVRTGAVDSALVRDAVAHAARDGRPGVLVFLSANEKDIVAALDALGVTQDSYVVVDSEHHLFTDTIPASAPTSTAVTTLLADHFVSYAAAAQDTYSWSTLITRIDVSGALAKDDFFGRYEGIETINATELAGDPILVGLRNVEVDMPDPSRHHSGDSAFVNFELVLLADVAIYGRSIDRDGVSHMQQTSMSDLVMVAPCAAQITQDAQTLIGGIHQTESATARSAEVRVDDPDDAIDWLIEELESLQDIAVGRYVREWARGVHDAEPDGAESAVVGPAGRVEADIVMSSVDPDNDPSAVWTICFEDVATVVCSYDPETRLWLGRDDSFDIREPYVVTASTPSSSPVPFVSAYRAVASIWAAVTTR